MDQDAAWYVGRRRPTRHCVRWVPSSPPLMGYSLQFLAIVRCGQTAGWTKMPLGMDLGIGPGDFVFEGDPATLRKKGTPPPPNFGPCLLWPNGWMDQDATWYGGKPRPRRRCVRWGHSSPLKGAQPPSFRFMSVVAKGFWMDEDTSTPLGTEVE